MQFSIPLVCVPEDANGWEELFVVRLGRKSHSLVFIILISQAPC